MGIPGLQETRENREKKGETGKIVEQTGIHWGRFGGTWGKHGNNIGENG